MRAILAVVLASATWGAGAPRVGADEARGPFELHDVHLLAQPRLTPAPAAPFTLGRGRTRVRLGLLWGNSFAWAQDAPGETPRARRYLIDGEALTLNAACERGLGERVDVGLRLPLQWRGGGRLDGFIDAFHRAFRFAGVGDGMRPAFRRDAWRVEGRTPDGRPLTWNGADGFGLGNLELHVRVGPARAGPGHGGGATSLRTARGAGFIARLSLPTGTGGFAGQGVALAAQALAARPLGTRAAGYAGVGALAGGSHRARGVGYARVRGHAFAVLERRLGARASLVAGSEIATRLARDVDGFPGTHWTAHAGAWLDLGRDSRLGLAVVENIVSQAATSDLTVHVAWQTRP